MADKAASVVWSYTSEEAQTVTLEAKENIGRRPYRARRRGAGVWFWSMEEV